MDETTITVSEGEPEAPEEQATNEHDVEVAQIEADAAVAQAAIMAEAQTTQAEIVTTAHAEEASNQADERYTRLENTVNELKGMVTEWLAKQEAQSQPTDILMISPEAEKPSSSEPTSEESHTSKESNQEQKEPGEKEHHKKAPFRPFGLQARKHAS